MKPTMRRFETDNDYQRIREFLRKVFLINNCWEKSWHVNRFDYWRWHGIMNMGHGLLEADVFIWENAEGEIVAVLNREAPGSVWLQVHPDYLSPELDREMMEVAEQYLTVPTDDGRRRHHIWIESDDYGRQELVMARGHVKTQKVEYQRRRDMSVAIKDAPLADGYTVRSMDASDDFPARSWVSWKAFHPNDPDEAYQGHNWYDNIQKAPLYSHDLDIVAVAPSGEFAAFCTVWFDDVTRTGVFEPVGTHPDHQRRGLARAVMTEGLRRLAERGAKYAYVGSWNEATHLLYGKTMGFDQYLILEAWEKIA